jgi:hypothetical protein
MCISRTFLTPKETLYPLAVAPQFLLLLQPLATSNLLLHDLKTKRLSVSLKNKNDYFKTISTSQTLMRQCCLLTTVSWLTG